MSHINAFLAVGPHLAYMRRDFRPAVPMSFDALGLDPRLVQAIERLGFEEPTPIQAQAIPPRPRSRPDSDPQLQLQNDFPATHA